MRKLALWLPLICLAVPGVRAQSNEAAGLARRLALLRDSSQYIDALNRMAMLAYEQSVDSIFVYAGRARSMADRLDYPKGKADALNNFGAVYEIRGNRQLALKYYEQAREVYAQLGDTADVVQTQMNMAMVYEEIGKRERSVSQFEAALQTGDHLQKDSILSLVIYNYLLLWPGQFNEAQTSAAIARAKSIAERFHDHRTLLALDQSVADNLMTHGQLAAGLSLLGSTIARALRARLFYASMDMQIDLGDQLSRADPIKAVSCFQRALAVAQKQDYLVYSEAITRRLFGLAVRGGDNRGAAVYGQRLIALHDREQELDNRSGIDYLDYAIKDQKIKTLAIQSRYQLMLLGLTGLVCLLALVIIFLFRRSLLRSRRLNTQISIALSALEQSQADNSRMMQIVAHDLRNPIGAITSLASLMLNSEERPEDDRATLELMRTSADHSLELVSDLLKVRTDAEDVPKEPVDLDRLLQYCVDLMENKAAAKSQRPQLSGKPLVIPAKREQLWRVVSNLIANAIKFSPSGAMIQIVLEAADQTALIAVRDYGIGIPEELRAHIFDMFTAAKRPGTAGEQPFGLGLAISQQIIAAHGGRIWYESHPGQGTTFFVELPLE